jgi:hypothetical protein
MQAFRPGDQIVTDGVTWHVSATIVERGGGRQWWVLALDRGTEIMWVSVDGDDVTRYEALPNRRVVDDALDWGGRTFTASARGTYAVTEVAGDTEAVVGDRASYLTLTNDDAEEWISVEHWEGGATEISVARPWRIDQVVQPGRS